MHVVAFGGNALQRPGESGTVHEMRANLRVALAPLESLLVAGTALLLTHGNGPQVGNALLRSDAAAAEIPPHPLDVAVATTQAEIGSLIALELAGLLGRLGIPDRQIAAVVTHVEVAGDDPALVEPSKPIGPFYDEATARSLERGRGWQMVDDSGRGWRRVVGSPQPRHVIELPSLRSLLQAGIIVIAAGGGGIPVSEGRGVEAVIDKDRTASLLARELDAHQLLILTAVDGVYRSFGSADEELLPTLTVREAEQLVASQTLPAGSMRPKVEAAAEFASATGRSALITSGEALGAALDGRAGTRIVAG